MKTHLINEIITYGVISVSGLQPMQPSTSDVIYVYPKNSYVLSTGNGKWVKEAGQSLNKKLLTKEFHEK